MPRPRDEAEPRVGDDRERAFAPAQQARQVVTGVVLLQTVEAIDDRPVGEDGAHADDLLPHGPVPQHVHAARIGRHHAADGCTVAGAEVDAEVPAGGPRVRLQPRERDARAGGDLRARDVDRPERVEAAEADDDLARERNRPAHEAGVATLGDDGDPGVVADADDRRDLRACAGPDDRGRGSAKSPGPVDGVGTDDLRVGEHVLGADRHGQCLEHGAGHGHRRRAYGGAKIAACRRRHQESSSAASSSSRHRRSPTPTSTEPWCCSSNTATTARSASS